MDFFFSISIVIYFVDVGLIFFVFFFVLFNGFFVVVEFVMVKFCVICVEIIVKQYGWCGVILCKVYNQLDVYLFVCQLGIILVFLGLGWVGELVFVEFLELLLVMIGVYFDELICGIFFFIVFFIIFYLYIVVGELVFKFWVICKLELLLLWMVVLLYFFYWLMYLVIWLFNVSVNVIFKIVGQGEFGLYYEYYYSCDELKLIFYFSCVQDFSDQGMCVLVLVVELGELEVVDWVNFCEDLVYFEYDVLLVDIFVVICCYKYSCYLVWDSYKGEFIGLLYIKDLLLVLFVLDSLLEIFDFDELVCLLEIVIKYILLLCLLEQFCKGGVYFVVVEEVDYKVVGFLIMEDVLEVLVGDIQDEYCKIECGIFVYQLGKLLVCGDILLFKFECLFGIDFDYVEVDIFVGLVYDILKWVLEEEEVFDIEGLWIIVKKMCGLKIVLVKVVKFD